jgi:phosphoenolpyruvate carboxykinase (ATP)
MSRVSRYGLEVHGIRNVNQVFWNLPTPAIYERAVQRGEGLVSHLGPLVVRTGHHTGRSPNDKFIVRNPISEDKIWWGENHPFEPERFHSVYRRLTAYMQMRDLFIQDLYAGADPDYRLRVRVVTEYAWHSLFARNMFLRPEPSYYRDFKPEFTVIDVPRFHALPELDGTESEVFIILNFAERVVVIGGTSYAGEIKKSVFTLLNYLLPEKGVLSMHCSANVGVAGDTALFFGLSGTGKTTLSADSERKLIGDDEHGWDDKGVFNIEGGCYAKVIRLSAEAEPEIYATTRRFGTILENVMIDSESRMIDLDDSTLTENTRAAYPISHLDNIVTDGRGSHPQNIVFLTADAFGVLPPIARLTPAQAMYHFLLGYTAKVAGTEKGVKEPQATFSACFGAPFMVLHPTSYARLLGEKVARHGSKVWLINTGWTGGPFGVGERIPINHTRAMVRAALAGDLDDVPMRHDQLFNIEVPTTCPDVPELILTPRDTWRRAVDYDARAGALARRFAEQFEHYADDVPEEVRESGPNL